jgi:nucleotide-binding universal stress UspA family protein
MASRPTIVCAVDTSDRAAHVLRHAEALADHFKAHLTVVTVEHPERTPPAEEILRTAQRQRADLLVIGTRGRNADDRSSPGSTAAAVLRDTDWPVLIVPDDAADHPEVSGPHSGPILAPTDFSRASNAGVAVAAGIAEALGRPLLLLHVVAPDPAQTPMDAEGVRLGALRELHQLSGSLRPAAVEHIIKEGNAATEIAATASERAVGLIVLALRSRRGRGRPQPGSTAYAAICQTPTLLLALPPRTLSGRATRRRQAYDEHAAVTV